MKTPMRLTDDELRDVLARAEEIQRASRKGAEWNAELERFNLSASPPVAGSLTWARSADGKFYVAEVLSTSEDGARVRFLGGSEHRVTLDQLRPCAFIPGQRVACNWPWWGPWTCTVVAYDSVKQRVELSDGWGSTDIFPVSEVWLAPDKVPSSASRTRVYATLVGFGVGAGALIGSIVTALLMR